jgi:hypothetical protein
MFLFVFESCYKIAHTDLGTMKVKIFITHHEDKRAEARALEVSDHRPDLFNPKLVPSNIFYESATFRDAHVTDPAVEFVGHLTYSYKSKIAPLDFEELCKKYQPSADVLALFPGNPYPLYQFAETVHPGFLKIWTRLMDLMGYKDFMVKGEPKAFYSNYWIATRDLWNKYVDFATTAMTHMSSDPELVALCSADSKYKGTIEALPPSKLQEISGNPYYTFHPFIMERLPCFFFHISNARIFLVDKPSEESWNSYAAFAGASFAKGTKSNNKLL